VNVHGSLLPKYRGSAPIQWAVLNGDAVTGVSTMYLAHEMDTGDVIYTEETAIGEFETSGELFERLKDMGAALLVKTLRDIEAGIAPRTPQDHSKASYVKMLDKSLCPIDWSRSPRAIVKQICGLQPWPVATMDLEGKCFRVFGAAYTELKTEKGPGAIVRADAEGLVIACADGQCLRITELQAPGKKRMPAADVLRGHRICAE
jgi:methionyl-tRNA formyltransferase